MIRPFSGWGWPRAFTRARAHLYELCFGTHTNTKITWKLREEKEQVFYCLLGRRREGEEEIKEYERRQ